jgi:hypothetical protein
MHDESTFDPPRRMQFWGGNKLQNSDTPTLHYPGFEHEQGVHYD